MASTWKLGTLLFAVLFGTAAYADESIDIKGFHAGMKRYELKGHLSDFCYLEGCTLSRKTLFTVGGVKGKLLAATYDADGTADSIDFIFDSFGFDHLRAAMLEKFPATRCEISEVITRLGLHVPQVICRFETQKDGIYLARVAGNINKSVMFVISAEKRQEVRDHLAAANKDL
jgi:hypothetical protein